VAVVSCLRVRVKLQGDPLVVDYLTRLKRPGSGLLAPGVSREVGNVDSTPQLSSASIRFFLHLSKKYHFFYIGEVVKLKPLGITFLEKDKKWKGRQSLLCLPAYLYIDQNKLALKLKQYEWGWHPNKMCHA